jgi:hypothetical protein
MRIHVYFRRNGETAYRDLGFREMGSVPAQDDNVIINVDRQTISARVTRVRSFLPVEHQAQRDPEIYLEGA